MAATTDFYSSEHLQIVGELMEALEPGMKSASSSTIPSSSSVTQHPSTPSSPYIPSTSSTSSPSDYDFQFLFPPSVPTQPGFYPDGCSTSTTPMFSDGISIQRGLEDSEVFLRTFGRNKETEKGSGVIGLIISFSGMRTWHIIVGWV